MSDVLVKWLVGVATTLSAAAVLGAAAAWFNLSDKVDGITLSLAEMRAERPYQEELRAIENEQIRQGMQLNTSQLNVIRMELEVLEERIRTLENGQ